ncbi:hypothetical protein BTVI_07874 [Pitangus sulphuratus]|nr:hypothetical protein BTVI_07874 [Pitangus sulphuratus]
MGWKRRCCWGGGGGGDLLCRLTLVLGFLLPACRTRLYTNHWAVRITGGLQEANRVASKYGYVNIGQIGTLKDYYHFYHSKTIKRSVLSSRGTHSFISMEPKVEANDIKSNKVKYQVLPLAYNNPTRAGEGVAGKLPGGERPGSAGRQWLHISRQCAQVAKKAIPGIVFPLPLHNDWLGVVSLTSPFADVVIVVFKVEWIQQQVVKRRIKRDYKAGGTQSTYFNDPKWPSMWYMHCSDNTHHCQSDMNIVGAWKRGYTGKNVVVTILDDGIERNHPDLMQNYDSQASFDVNGNDFDPMPRYDASNENKMWPLTRGLGRGQPLEETVSCEYSLKDNLVLHLNNKQSPVDPGESPQLTVLEAEVNLAGNEWQKHPIVTGPEALCSLGIDYLRRGYLKDQKGIVAFGMASVETEEIRQQNTFLGHSEDPFAVALLRAKEGQFSNSPLIVPQQGGEGKTGKQEHQCDLESLSESSELESTIPKVWQIITQGTHER